MVKVRIPETVIELDHDRVDDDGVHYTMYINQQPVVCDVLPPKYTVVESRVEATVLSDQNRHGEVVASWKKKHVPDASGRAMRLAQELNHEVVVDEIALDMQAEMVDGTAALMDRAYQLILAYVTYTGSGDPLGDDSGKQQANLWLKAHAAWLGNRGGE